MKKKTKAIICTAAIAGVVGVSGLFAYLTDTDTASNKFTVGKVDIELQEPSWDGAVDSDGDEVPDFAENIVPNATIAKDPQVKNVGLNDAYVYLKVTVPVVNVKTAASDGTLLNNGEKANTELFTYELEENSKWVQIGNRAENKEGEGENEKVVSYTYVYYYNETVAPNATTDKLFTNVKVANIIENEVEPESQQQIDIEAYAIQADNLPDGTTKESAYDIYVKQNTKK